jgi:uncharacterized membrane protein
MCGAAFCISAAVSPLLGVLLGAVGGVAGALAGYNYRRRLAVIAPGLLLALLEDLVAVGGGFLLVSRG